MPGLILHHFHGSTQSRAYNQRWKLLQRTGFGPRFEARLAGPFAAHRAEPRVAGRASGLRAAAG